MKYAQVALQQKIGDGLLTYCFDEKLSLQLGQLVKVPLKKSFTNGLVFQISETKPAFKTSEIKEILETKTLLSPNQIALAKWLSQYYFCPLYKVLKLFVPKRIWQNKTFRLKQPKTEKITVKHQEKVLTKEQNQALKTIFNSLEKAFLIHGITGSGKTEIYSQLAKKYIESNKQVLILLPEISLTPQNIEYFEKSLGIKATVINSKIAEGEKYLAWKAIWNNKTKLIIGSRSAIFAPFQDLAVIIIDEEHENSYKQENSPRYSTHNVAEKIIELYPTAKLVLGSATPSIEIKEKYQHSTIELKERIGEGGLPVVEIVDLRDEFKKGNFSIFSDRLKEELTNILQSSQQAILFLNRRGQASSVVCRDCGYTEKCPNCETKMTYHKNQTLICHHCGKISTPPQICIICKSLNIRFLGIGTQKIEQELSKIFPEARFLRADKDTTMGKHDFEKIYQKFKNHEADILIGTQMIAKGLHLPKVNLVGVVLADIGLNIPDYKTAEKNFQLMTQVAGRAGRSNKNGIVIIQTYNPENLSLIATQNHSYQQFYTFERTQRKILKNPPFGKLAKLVIENKSLIKAKNEAEKIKESLEKIANNQSNPVQINTYPAYIGKLHNKYRQIVLMKSENNHDLLEKLPKEYIMSPNIKIDIDPISTT